MGRVIPLHTQGIEELLAHTQMLQWLAAERQRHQEEVQRLHMQELMVREGMTYWIAHHYGIDLTQAQWRLDLDALQLVEEETQDTPLPV